MLADTLLECFMICRSLVWEFDFAKIPHNAKPDPNIRWTTITNVTSLCIKMFYPTSGCYLAT